MASMSLSSRAVASRTTPAGVPPSGALEKAVYRNSSGRGAFVVMPGATRGECEAIPGGCKRASGATASRIGRRAAAPSARRQFGRGEALETGVVGGALRVGRAVVEGGY